jgi:tRNA G18 (ribose-2'-O)-methylase SpoU
LKWYGFVDMHVLGIPLSSLPDVHVDPELGIIHEEKGNNANAENNNSARLASQPIVLVMGSEGRGLRHVVTEACDALIMVEPMLKADLISESDDLISERADLLISGMSHNVDSLNVSVAGAVLLHGIRELQRK